VRAPFVYVPAAAYVPFVQTGKLIFLSGHIAKKEGKPWVGQLGLKGPGPGQVDVAVLAMGSGAALGLGVVMGFVFKADERWSTDDDRAMAWVLDQTRVERRRAPFLQGLGRLHVVVAVEQHAPARSHRGRRAPMPDHHRLAQSRLDPRLESDLAQSAGASISSLDAGIMKGRIGRDAGNGKQLEQPLKGRLLFACEPVEHALQRAR